MVSMIFTTCCNFSVRTALRCIISFQTQPKSPTVLNWKIIGRVMSRCSGLSAATMTWLLLVFAIVGISEFSNGQNIGGQNGFPRAGGTQGGANAGGPFGAGRNQENRGGVYGGLGGVEPTGQYPNPQYYLALEIYRTGDLALASEAFEEALRLGRRDIRGRWIDSIPTLAMLAECQWYLGNLIGARDYIDQAMQIAIVHRGWLSRVDWASMLQPAQQKAVSSTLWPQAQAVRLAPIANQVMFQSGQPLTEQSLLQGGPIEEPNIRTMDMVEIMRGMATACYRRRVLLGPLCDQDNFVQGLLQSTQGPANLAAPIGRTMIAAMRLSEYLAYYEDRTVLEQRGASALFNGATHPLSSIVLLTQISAMLDSGQHEAVLALALQATHFSGAWGQSEWIGEALQLAAGCATIQQAQQVRQVAEFVAESIARYSPLAAYHGLIAGADAAITAGDLESAERLISKWKLFQSRRDFLQPRLDAYASYVAARFAAAGGASSGIDKPSAYDLAMDSVTGFAVNHRFRNRSLVSMPYLYQMGIIQSSLGKQLGATTSEKLLRIYCDQPRAAVWRRDPVNGVAGVVADRSLAQNARLKLAVSAGYAESFLTTWNETLNTKFLNSLPLSGRILQVRHLAKLEEQQMADDLLAQRKQMGPKMVRLMGEIRADAKADTNDLNRINQMEARATQIALDRFQVPQVIPPVLKEKDPTDQLPEQTAMITFTVLGNQIIGTISDSTKVRMWQVGSVAQCGRGLSVLLKEFGVGKLRGDRLPEDETWLEQATKLRDFLFGNSEIAFDQLKAIVIVPDGLLWYVPFELLPYPEHATDLIVDRIDVRYAPTPGYALKTIPLKPKGGDIKIALTGDLFFAPRDLEKNEATIEELIGLVPNSVRLTGESSLPSYFLGSSATDLLIAKPQFINPKLPLTFHLAAYDQGAPMGTLKTWLRFPLLAPQRVVLGGLRTSVDGGQMDGGDGLFQILCAAHTSGVDEILVSRWAVGGESSATLFREMINALPEKSLTDSWRVAREVLRVTELNPADEPLLTKAEHRLQDLKGKEPLFWSGYLLSAPHFREDPVVP